MEPLARGTGLITCPKCAYTRTAADNNPEWQCPRCEIAYNKFSAAAPKLRTLAGEARADRSVYPLIAANLLAIALALATRMSLRELMLVYWMQSVIIGLSFAIRMLSLERFTTDGLKMNDQPLEATPRNRTRIAFFFAIHYGFFHFVYLMFLAFDPASAKSAPWAALGFWFCAAGFALSHGYSLLQNIAKDRAGEPNLGTLMMLPYARIVPMHATILAGGLLHAGAATLILFCVLKTVADVVMHTVEHHVLRTSRPAEGSQDSVSSTTS